MSPSTTSSTSISETIVSSHTHKARSTIPSNILPHKPDRQYMRSPQTGLKKSAWRIRMWFEATFVFSMLEPWEQFLLLSLFAITSYFILRGLVRYLPDHLFFLSRRAVYYFSGREGDEDTALAHWLDSAINMTRQGLGISMVKAGPEL